MVEGIAGDADDLLVRFSASSRLAGYRLEEQIGAGGMARVFRATDERLGRQVALKMLSPSLAANDAFRQRFIRESRTAAAVDDPHIIPVYEADEAHGVLFIAMRYVPTGDVLSLIRREGPLSPGRAVAIVSAVASALDAAHAAGLVHRDVKPANMLVDLRPNRPDHVYLSDFGLGKATMSSTRLTLSGVFVGTVDYSAPEQIEGKHLDGRADQYSLACSAFELLSGSPPFPREEMAAGIAAHLFEPPPLLSSRMPGMPRAADQVLVRALAKVAADRFATCREFADALEGALSFWPSHGAAIAAPGSVHLADAPLAQDRPATEIAPAMTAQTDSADQPASQTRDTGASGTRGHSQESAPSDTRPSTQPAAADWLRSEQDDVARTQPATGRGGRDRVAGARPSIGTSEHKPEFLPQFDAHSGRRRRRLAVGVTAAAVIVGLTATVIALATASPGSSTPPNAGLSSHPTHSGTLPSAGKSNGVGSIVIKSPPAGSALNNSQSIQTSPVLCGFSHPNKSFTFAPGLTGTVEPATNLALPVGSTQYIYVGADAGGNPLTSISWMEDLSVVASYSGNKSVSIGNSTNPTGNFNSNGTTNVAIAGLGVTGYRVVGKYRASQTFSGTLPSISVTFTTGAGDLALLAVGGEGVGLLQHSGVPLATFVNETYSECGSNVIASAAMFGGFETSGSHTASFTGTTYGTNAGAALGVVAYVLAPMR